MKIKFYYERLKAYYKFFKAILSWIRFMFVGGNFLWSEKVLNLAMSIANYRADLDTYPSHTTTNPRNPLVDQMSKEDIAIRRRLGEGLRNAERDLSSLIARSKRRLQ